MQRLFNLKDVYILTSVNNMVINILWSLFPAFGLYLFLILNVTGCFFLLIIFIQDVLL